MKVNISYSVELDEVLASVQETFIKEHTKYVSVSSGAANVLNQDYTDENVSALLEAINAYKRAMVDLDGKLTEIGGILVGYQRIKYQELVPAAPEPTAGREVENDQL
jgi:hypothetical protein